jgi:hypothetical protein
MSESENTVQEQAYHGSGLSQRVCRQLVGDRPKYSLWLSRHDRRMFTVAVLRQRERQLLTLRSVAIEQIHRTALVRYLREFGITGQARTQTLREFYGVLDPQRSAINEHRSYLIAASSQLCANDLLEMAGDNHGREMIQRYEATYGTFFSMFCDRARARENGTPYLLASLLPDVKITATKLRGRILSGQLLPVRPSSTGHFKSLSGR